MYTSIYTIWQKFKNILWKVQADMFVASFLIGPCGVVVSDLKDGPHMVSIFLGNL